VFLSDDTLYPISLKLFSLVGNIASGTPPWNLFAAGSLLNLALIAALTAVSQYGG
jgi:multiple sugar transport system permease protein